MLRYVFKARGLEESDEYIEAKTLQEQLGLIYDVDINVKLIKKVLF